MKKIGSLLLAISTIITLLAVDATATEFVPDNEIEIPQSAVVETVDGKNVYSNFVDTEGNYYDYYCPEDGSYFRWTPGEENDNIAVAAASTYEEIRDFEFKFAADGLNGKTNNNTFTISYDAGKYTVSSYLYDHYQGRRVDSSVKYGFTVELMQDKFGFDKSIATLSTKTDSTNTKTFTCTTDKSYYFVFKPTDNLPANTSNHMYYFMGDGTIYGKTA